MCNIAQIANVLQSMILTQDDKMVLTPTYYVFKMYKPHQDATFIPMDIACDEMQVKNERYRPDRSGEEPTRTLPMLSATASRNAEGVIHISLANIDLKQKQEVTINLADIKGKKVKGEILTSKNMGDHNSFDNPEVVRSIEFKAAKIIKEGIKVVLPPMSIVTLEVL